MTDTISMSCEEAIRQIASYLDGELDGAVRSKLEEHLDRCRSCCSRHEFEKGLKERLAGLGRESIRPDFEARIRNILSRFPEDDERSAEPWS